MDDLIQANLELYAELGKEVRINLENKTKISRLEKQQVRYEKDIQYLYRIIDLRSNPIIVKKKKIP